VRRHHHDMDRSPCTGEKRGNVSGFLRRILFFRIHFRLPPNTDDSEVWLAVALYPARWDEPLSVSDIIQVSTDPHSATFRVVLYKTSLLDQGRMGAGFSSRTLLWIFDQPGQLVTFVFIRDLEKTKLSAIRLERCFNNVDQRVRAFLRRLSSLET